MSETWPPSTPKDSEDTGAAGTEDTPTSADPIALGPAKPAYWREYPYAGAPPASPCGPVPHRREPRRERAGHPPGGHLAAPSVRRYLAPSAAPGAAPGGPGAPTPPFGGWPPPPGYAAPAPQPTSPKKRGLVAAMAAVFAIVAVLAGAGLGHFVWPSTTTSAASNPNVLVPGGSGSLGGGSSPFGSGSSGGELSPFGSGSGSTGNSSTGAGAPSDISAIAAKVSPDLVDINTNLSYQDEQAAGTGMVLTSSGLILTNNHVIDGATSISATDVGNGKTYSAKVVGYDRTGDIAVIKLVGASGLRTISTSAGTAAVGQAVVGVGNAGGTGGTPSAAGGSITALGQSITASDNGGGNSENLTGLIETNAGIQPGDSGGSLVNTSGQVIGMDTAASAGPGYQVIGQPGLCHPHRHRAVHRQADRGR